MKEIEARGLLCPKPIIMAKYGLEETDEIKIFVNEEAIADLAKLAQAMGASYTETKLAEDEYEAVMKIVDPQANEEFRLAESNKEQSGVVIFVGNDLLGTGEEELGKKLMQSMIYTISETKPLPKTMIFYANGSRLTTEENPSSEDLKKMAINGVEILTCGTCLDYHQKRDKLMLGEVANMYQIYELLSTAENTITFE